MTNDEINCTYSFYASYEERIESFSDWPCGLSQTKEDMAKAGFFYTGISDKVICFSCGLKLNQWQPTDEPLAEHAKHLGTCEFMSTNIRSRIFIY